MKPSGRSLVFVGGSVVMADSSDRKELERRLEQAKRIADLPVDPLTKERLQRLVRELEEQLRLSE
jgi:hypothetical protein